MGAAKFVILGGGMVAGYAAKQFVELGLKSGELAILSSDTSIPYERPPLSKGFLAGKDTEEAIRINTQDFYREHGIEVELGVEVSAVDCKRKRLTLRSGEDFGFEELMIATGAHPRILEIPGARLQQVFYLRSMDDSKSIRRAAERAKRAVVIGGGFIGMEVAAVLAQKNIEVTMVLNQDRIWKHLFTPEMSGFFERYYTSRGVQIMRNARVSELRGNDSVRSVALANGQAIECDLVVAGIGVRPATEMLANSGLQVADGLMVNEYLEASLPDVCGGGDAANYQDVLFAKRRRVEHWDNAVSQGQYLGRALMGERIPFKHVPYFFSDVFDLSYEYWGDASVAEEVVHRGDVSSNSFSVWWLREGRVVGAFTMNRPDEEREAAPKWIESRQVVSRSRLQDAAQPLLAAAA
jgi:NADPH-dependent 2,4-dienoyl-CoA reductase/sulfur reductase-like enzyme